jgi:hypothetical protein
LVEFGRFLATSTFASRAGRHTPGIGRRLLLRKVEIDGGLFQIAMPQQDLEGPQIRTVFEQVSGETVPHVWGWTSLRIPARWVASLQANQMTLGEIG